MIGKAEVNSKCSPNYYQGDYYYFYPTKDSKNIAFIINPNLSKTRDARKVLKMLPKKSLIEKLDCDALFDAEQRYLMTKSLENWQLPKGKPERDPLTSWKQCCKNPYESIDLKNCLTPPPPQTRNISYAILKKQLHTCAWCNNILWKGKYFDRCTKCRVQPNRLLTIESFKKDQGNINNLNQDFLIYNNPDWINDKYIF
jgi:hypothetical protein